MKISKLALDGWTRRQKKASRRVSAGAFWVKKNRAHTKHARKGNEKENKTKKHMDLIVVKICGNGYELEALVAVG